MNSQALGMKQKNLPTEFKAAFLIFLLASSFVFGFLPHMFADNNTQPPFLLYLSAGLVAVIVTSLLLGYVSRLGLGFSKSALVLSFGYGVIIASVKLVVAPVSLYTANSQSEFEVSFFDPNDPSYYISTAAIVLLLYIIVFTIIYKLALKRAKNAGLDAKQNKSKKVKARYITLTVAGIAVFLYSLVYYSLPLLAAGTALNYFNYVLGTFGTLIIIALILATFFAQKGFENVSKQAIANKNPTLLASFFWIGISLIFLYHVMWVVFMLALVQLWPFRTYTPK